MKILIKFDYENKTYYVYQEDNEIKYGTNEDMKNVSLEDENIIKKVIEKLRPSKYLIELTPFVYNGKKYDIYLDTKTNFKIFNPIPDEKEIIKFNKIFNDMPLELNIELNNKEKEFIRKAVTLGKKTVIAFLASTIILSNTSFFPDIIINAKVDDEITYIEELKEENERLKKYIDYLKEKNDALKKNYRGNKKKNKENERKAKVFDKLYRILFSKFSYHTDIHDIYGVGKFENVKYGQYFDSSMDMEKLTDKEIVSVINIFLEGINAEYRIEWFGYSGLNEPDNGGSYVSIKVDEQAKKDVHDYNELDKSKTDLTNN